MELAAGDEPAAASRTVGCCGVCLVTDPAQAIRIQSATTEARDDKYTLTNDYPFVFRLNKFDCVLWF